MNRNFVEPLIAVLAVIFIVGLMPLLGQAADDTQTLQQLSQSFADIAKEVTQSIVSIKIDGRRRPEIRKRRFFEEDEPDYRWHREMPHERYFNPENFRFFFDDPEDDKNPQWYKKYEFRFSIPDRSYIPPEIRRFIPNEDWKRYSGQYGLGAGIIVSPDGYIVTASPLVEEADKIRVALSDEREFEAELTGSDPKTGIAVIKIDAEGLPVAKLGDSEQLSVGEIVLAIGHPHGFINTVSIGVVSGLGRAPRITEYENLIQTDAVISPGSSGGALVNSRGEVVGMNIGMFSESRGYEGIGFAIPINTVENIKDQLIDSGEVVRGWLGVAIQNVDADIAQKFELDKPQGAMVSRVMDGSPALEAGIEKGDVIVSFDDQPVKDVNHLRNLVAEVEPGRIVTISVIRDGQKQDIEVTIGKMPADIFGKMQRSKVRKSRLGVMLQDVDEDLAEKFKLEEPQGALVNRVMDASPAEAAGIKEGDVIVAFDGKSVKDSKQLRDLVAKAKPGEITITVVRDGQKKDIQVTISEMSSQVNWRGITLQELTDELAQKLGYKSHEGILITSVEPGSRASKAGLKVNDLIIEVERQTVSNPSEFQDIVKDMESSVLLHIKRGEWALFVIVK